MLKKYKVIETECYRWAMIDKTYIVEAGSEEEAREYIQNYKNWPLDCDEEELISVEDYLGVDDINVKEIK